MNKTLLPWSAAVGAAVSLTFSSCTYDPYYSSVSGSYQSGYGDGYGYGGSNFSTSLFVSTGDPRWGYDPYSYCYYDYRSRRYYDPYLYGFYPTGYRPYAVRGVPHPHGWRPGRSYCPPPQTVRNVTVVNYRNRESAYRNTDYSWARQVRQQPERPQDRGDYNRSNNSAIRPDYGPRPAEDRSWLSPFGRGDTPRETRSYPETRNRSGSRPPAQYNTPVQRPDVIQSFPDRFNRDDYRRSPRTQDNRVPQYNRPERRDAPAVPPSRPDFQAPRESPQAAPAPVAPPPAPPTPPPMRSDEAPSRGESRGGLRSLGEG